MARTLVIQDLTFRRTSTAYTTHFNIGTDMEGKPQTAALSIELGDEFGECVRDEPTPEQIAAAGFLLEHHVSLLEQIHTAIRVFLGHFKNESWFMDDGEFPNADDDLADFMTIDEFSVRGESYDGFAWIGVAGGCDWDEEHGLGISIWKDLVLDVGQAEISYSSPDSGWNVRAHLSQADQQRRDAVLESLTHAIEQRHEEDARAFQESLPDSVKLAQALMTKDNAEAQRLMNCGVDVNHIPAPYEPPLFMAMQSFDIDTVKAFLEAGASLNAKNQLGQTPLEFAEQILQMQRAAQQTRAGMAGGLESMMAALGMVELPDFLTNDDLTRLFPS